MVGRYLPSVECRTVFRFFPKPCGKISDFFPNLAEKFPKCSDWRFLEPRQGGLGWRLNLLACFGIEEFRVKMKPRGFMLAKLLRNSNKGQISDPRELTQ